jgi:serine/threonine protein kinase
MQPEKFGNSLILMDKLASGGMGEVFKAKQIGTEGFEKTVAVKRILPHFATREDFSKLFKQEMLLSAKLQHSNVAQVFSNGSFAEYLYLVMEYVNGKTLSELISLCTLRGEQLSVKHCCYIISEAAKGLHYAHSLRDENTGTPLNIVHRDVTPQNIMCSENGEVKVLDFGIAKVVDNISELSRIGDVKGKMQYVAPEQLEGKRASAQSDVFSLGVTMFELLTRTPLFLDESPFHTINNVMNMTLPPLSDYRDDVPAELEKILGHALQKDPEKRYHTAEDFHRDLSEFLSSNFPSYSSTELGRTVQILSNTNKDHVNRGPLGPAAQALSNDVTKRFTTSALRRKQEQRLRFIRIGVSVIIGATLGLGYLYYKRLPSGEGGGYLATAPIATFVADDITASADGKITTWGGQSQHGGVSFEQLNDANKPLLVPHGLAGHATVKFDGSQYLTSLNVAERYTTASQATFIVVAKIQPDRIGYLFSLHQANSDADVIRLGMDDSSHLRVKTTENPGIRMFLTTETKHPTDFSIISVVVDSGAIQLHLNGALMVPGTLPETIAFSKSHIMTLGMEYDQGNPSDFFVGEIAEVLFFNSCLNSFYRSLIEESLSAKYGIKITKGT